MAELGARAPPGSRAEHLPLCHEVTDQGGCFGAYNLPFLRPRGTGLPLSVWLSPPDFTGGTKTRHRLSPRPMLGSASPTTPLLGPTCVSQSRLGLGRCTLGKLLIFGFLWIWFRKMRSAVDKLEVYRCANSAPVLFCGHFGFPYLSSVQAPFETPPSASSAPGMAGGRANPTRPREGVHRASRERSEHSGQPQGGLGGPRAHAPSPTSLGNSGQGTGAIQSRDASPASRLKIDTDPEC